MPKSETGWASVPAGKLKTAESRLWVALGNFAKMVAEQLDADTAYRLRVADFMIHELPVKALDPLKRLATIPVSACAKFVAKDRFVVDTSVSAKVKIGYLGDNFRQFFLTKTEKNIPACKLAVHTLECNSLDADIRRELTPEREETALFHFYGLLSRQPHGEEGNLLTNGFWNIFYIKDAKGNPWAVHASWSARRDGWFVDAHSVALRDEWYAGRQVFSRE